MNANGLRFPGTRPCPPVIVAQIHSRFAAASQFQTGAEYFKPHLWKYVLHKDHFYGWNLKERKEEGGGQQLSRGKQRSKACCSSYAALDETTLLKMHLVLIFHRARGSMSELSLGEAIILSAAHLMLFSAPEPHRNILLRAQAAFRRSAAMNATHEHQLNEGLFKIPKVSFFLREKVFGPQQNPQRRDQRNDWFYDCFITQR